MTRLSFRCERLLVEAVDAVRGDIPRERWLRRAVEEKLARGPSPTFPEFPEGFVSATAFRAGRTQRRK